MCLNRQRRPNMTEKIQSIPEAKLLLASLRSVGYNEETAIADIIDNSISAQAHKIKIVFDWEQKRIVISDDGFGMSEDDLIENMRIGSSDPNKIRSEDDLGRFGMGMKTAAFSLGKKLTIITKSGSSVSNASWDLDRIPEIGWNLLIRDENEISEFSSQMGEQGTIVVIENLDRVLDIADEKKAQNKFYRVASKTEKHLALTFHRFIEEEDLILELNGARIKAWNPFVVGNSATQELPEESIFSDSGCAEVTIQPYVLPHKTKFASDDDYQTAGGPKGWNYHQGIYVYRNRRLIICGTWFDYIKKEPAYNLARIKIDITSASDEDWKIDIKKSTATPPSYVREAIEREIDLCTETSARVYNSRGSYTKSNAYATNLDYVWEQRKKNGRYSFHINRKHSLLSDIKKQLDDQGKSILSAYLTLVENFAPFMQSGVTDSLQNRNRTQNTIYLRLNYNEPSGTVLNVRKSMWIHPTQDRAISIREAARLQTFPDSFVFCGSKDKQYQQVGNAVPPFMAKAIAKQLAATLGKKLCKVKQGNSL